MTGTALTQEHLPSGSDIDRIQRAQFAHDNSYHAEIRFLSVKARLTHMCLHFAKYTGELLDEPNDAGLRRLITDVFVIATSTLNVLDTQISRSFNGVHGGSCGVSSAEELARDLALFNGRIAAACEKLDHLEDVAFRRVIQENAMAIFSLFLNAALARGWKIENLVRDRLEPVRRRKFLHG